MKAPMNQWIKMIAEIIKRDSQTVNVFWWKKKITLREFIRKKIKNKKINWIWSNILHIYQFQEKQEKEDVKWHHSVTISKILTVESSTKQMTKFLPQMICKGNRKRTYKLHGSSWDIAIINKCMNLGKVKVTQCCWTFWDPMDCTVHGNLQARTLEWVAFLSPGDLPNPGSEPGSPALQEDSLPTELSGKPNNNAWTLCKSNSKK